MSYAGAESAAGPLVSVVMPVHDGADHVGAALASLRAQRFGDWEAVVVDDGSLDRTVEIVGALAGEDARIRLIRGAHAGAAAARNLGIGHALGAWVLFLDADDVLTPDHLEGMAAAIAARPDADLLHASWCRLGSEGDVLAAEEAEELHDPLAATAASIPFQIHAALTRRASLDAVGRFDAGITVGEDWDLWQRLALAGARFAPVPAIWAESRARANSLSSDTATHLRQGLRIIDRGFDAVEARDGQAASATREDARAAIAFWAIGAAVGRDQDIAPLLAMIDDKRFGPGLNLWQAAMHFSTGVLAGHGRGGTIPLALLPRIDRAMGTIAGWLEGIWNPDAGALFSRMVEDRTADRVTDLAPFRIGLLRQEIIDLTKPLAAIDADPSIARIRLRMVLDGDPVLMVERFMVGALPAGEIAADLVSYLGESEHAVAFRRRWVKEMGAAGLIVGESPSKLVRAWRQAGHDAPRLGRRDRLARALFMTRISPAGEARADPIAALVHDEWAEWQLDHAPASSVSGAAGDHVPPDYTSEAHWESVFETPDPWDYGNGYETEKFRQTLDLMPEGVSGDVLELACAEGHLTRLIATRAERLLATDISPTAILHARARCADLGNVEFARLDMIRDRIEGRFDVILISEVLYYFPDRRALEGLMVRAANALREGGTLILAHARLGADEPDATSFGWPHPFGSKTFGEVAEECPSLSLARETLTPLYRLQAFRKGPKVAEPGRTLAFAARRLPLAVAGQVQWRGAPAPAVAERWNDIPILMYHRIADHGPAGLAQFRLSPSAFEGQLALLRGAGWQGITMRRVAEAIHLGRPVPPRTVVLTFDDAYVDFLEDALPLLHRHGFPATVFVPAGRVGTASDWDAAYGEPAPILDWDDIAALVHADVELGSHARSHAALPVLTPERAIRELASSRAELSERTGTDIPALAYPYGLYHRALADAASRCGYHVAVTTTHGWVEQGAEPLGLPRLEVRGDMPLADFADMLGIER